MNNLVYWLTRIFCPWLLISKYEGAIEANERQLEKLGKIIAGEEDIEKILFEASQTGEVRMKPSKHFFRILTAHCMNMWEEMKAANYVDINFIDARDDMPWQVTIRRMDGASMDKIEIIKMLMSEYPELFLTSSNKKIREFAEKYLK